ncbi:MAG: hypothetical protein V4631_21130 [Pseudomonadota bacterium]
MGKVLDKFRMLIWFLIGAGLYFTSTLIGSDHPAWQTIAYKMGHVTTLAWVGYWISRMAVGRIDARSTSNDKLARAIVIAGVIIAGSLGL